MLRFALVKQEGKRKDKHVGNIFQLNLTLSLVEEGLILHFVFYREWLMTVSDTYVMYEMG
ncbi:hypothetical protein BDZ91DRAFT_730534 [Kalaharituber pfeilii]|nr:hypothetical protein BDZ91DRAFT_730534 [Kalaharituber pfeilii]